MKKWLAYILAAILLLSLAACGSVTESPSVPGTQSTEDGSSQSTGGGDDADKKDITPENKTIRVAFNGGWWEDASKYDFVFDNFKAKYPEYTIERVENIVNVEQLLASIQSGTQPDFWLSNDLNSAGYSAVNYGGYLEPVTEYLQKDSVVNFDNMDPKIMNMFKFIDDEYYGLPYATSYLCMVYNKTIFKQHAQYNDNPPGTWDEMYEAAKEMVITDSSGNATQVGFSMAGTDGPYTYQILPTLKKSELDEYGLYSRYSEGYVQDAFEYCEKFDALIKGKIPAGAKFQFSEGNAGMAITSLTQLTDLTAASLDFGIAPLPKAPGMDESVLYAYIWQYMGIPHGAKNPDGGWFFAKYVTTDVLPELTKQDLISHPKMAIPDYMAHRPTREKVDTLYAATLDTAVKAIYEERNKILDETEFYTFMDTPIKVTLQTINEEMTLKRKKDGLSLGDFLRELGTRYDAELKIWLKVREDEGWQFPEGGKPVPPNR